MTRRALIVVTILVLVGVGCARGPDLDAIVRPYVDGRTVAGVSIAVARHGEVIAARGYGHAELENEVPARPDTVYAIGPITKEFTAVAVLQLVAAGKLALDDDVRKYLPDIATNGRRLTIHHLLSHTSGLKDFEYDSWWRTKALDRTPEEMLALWRALPLLFAPGDAFAYSSTGYGLLGVIIEKVSGQPLERYLADHVIQPAGLPHTRACSAREIIPHRASGYTSLDGHLGRADLVVLDQYGGAGELCSTAGDLVAWVRARAGLVAPALRARMATPVALSDGTTTGYGYGVIVSATGGHRFIGSQGGVPGFAAALYHYVDDDLTVAVLTNTDTVDAMKIESEVAALMLHAAPPEFKAPETALPADERAAVPGTYALRVPGERPVIVAIEGNRVLVDERPVRHIGPRTFVDRNGQVLRFGDVAHGKARSLVLEFFGIRMEARRPD